MSATAARLNAGVAKPAVHLGLRIDDGLTMSPASSEASYNARARGYSMSHRRWTLVTLMSMLAIAALSAEAFAERLPA